MFRLAQNLWPSCLRHVSPRPEVTVTLSFNKTGRFTGTGQKTQLSDLVGWYQQVTVTDSAHSPTLGGVGNSASEWTTRLMYWEERLRDPNPGRWLVELLPSSSPGFLWHTVCPMHSAGPVLRTSWLLGLDLNLRNISYMHPVHLENLMLWIRKINVQEFRERSRDVKGILGLCFT